MKTTNKENYWSQFVANYEEKQSFVSGKEVLASVKEEIGRERNLNKVLELGCGTGLFTAGIKDRATEVLATDFSEEMIEAAIKTRGTLENVRFKKANALDLTYKRESFDTVFMANLIHIIGDSKKVIEESHKVLKPGGTIIITSFAINEMSFFNKIKIAFRYMKAFGKPSEEATREKTTRQQIENLLNSLGFSINKNLVLGRKEKSFYITAEKK